MKIVLCSNRNIFLLFSINISDIKIYLTLFESETKTLFFSINYGSNVEYIMLALNGNYDPTSLCCCMQKTLKSNLAQLNICYAWMKATYTSNRCYLTRTQLPSGFSPTEFLLQTELISGWFLSYNLDHFSKHLQNSGGDRRL